MARKKPAPELVRNVRALFGNDRTQANLKPIKKCLAVRHVAFEDLGLLGPLVSSRGYGVRYHDAGVQPIDAETLLAPDLLIVLGGPIGVYEADTYPFIADEIAAVAAWFETWLVGHTGQLGKAGIAPRRLRDQAREFGAATREAGQKAFSAWLDK